MEEEKPKEKRAEVDHKHEVENLQRIHTVGSNRCIVRVIEN